MITYIYIVALCLALIAALRHDVQMFQQNSYRYARYFKWWEGNFFSAELAKILLVSLTLGAGLGLAHLSNNSDMLPIALSVGYAAVFIVEFRKKFKVKIAYTDRVKRLLLTSFVVVAAMSTCVYFLASPLQFVAISAVVVVLSNVVLLLANLINTPLEKCITQWYINDARKILASRKDLIVIGVTGSYGKTSTKSYLCRMLTEKYNVLVTPGNYNTLLGVVRTVRENLRPQHQVFIVEMGAKQRGDIKEICDLVHPSIGIVTSVGEAHLETFKSVENIQKTKFELIDSLPKDGLGLINLDSDSIRDYNYSTQCKVVSYAVEQSGADYQAHDVNYNTSGVNFNLAIGGEEVALKSPLLGGGNVLNLTAGAIVASHLGVNQTQIKRAMQQIQSVEHRLSMSKAGGLTILDDAYNSNPAGAKMALDVLANFVRPAGAKRIVITPGFVEMGSSQFDANYKLGCQIAESVDYAVVVNKLNREAIIKGLNDSQFDTNKYYIADSLAQARAHLATLLKVGDVVLYENDLPDSFK